MKYFIFIFCFFFINDILLFSQDNEIYNLKYLNNSEINAHIDTVETGSSMVRNGSHNDSTLVTWAEYKYKEGLNIIFNNDGTLFSAGYCKKFLSFKYFFKSGHFFKIRKIGLWIEYDYLENKYINHFFYVNKYQYYQIKTDENGKIIGDDILYRN